MKKLLLVGDDDKSEKEILFYEASRLHRPTGGFTKKRSDNMRGQDYFYYDGPIGLLVNVPDNLDDTQIKQYYEGARSALIFAGDVDQLSKWHQSLIAVHKDIIENGKPDLFAPSELAIGFVKTSQNEDPGKCEEISAYCESHNIRIFEWSAGHTSKTTENILNSISNIDIVDDNDSGYNPRF